MRMEEIKDILEAKVLFGQDYLDREIKLACGSDLLSDVLTFIRPEALLLTGLINAQVVRTAEMAEISAVCFVHGKTPHKDTVKLAQEKKIPLLITKLSMYESCGRLYKAGLPGCHDAQ